MTRAEAMAILMERGHDEIGADNNIDYVEEEGTLETITKDELIALSINYWED